MDRSIRATVRLGNGLELDGESTFQPQMPATTFYPLVYAGDSGKPSAEFCYNGSLDGAPAASAWVLMNAPPYGYTTLADAHVLPASHISYADGLSVQSYLNKSSSPVAAIIFKRTVLGTSPAPAIAGFSSRGPSLASPGILKPDIAGPR
uniref:Uncharacterized protein n=1 Tax=Ananas comosus var. bracteatus TaxID=296719 RepID=A0A6V7QPY1_ANACO|nr:unnamed protein product [Ananas comosus var. bracteatus]